MANLKREKEKRKQWVVVRDITFKGRGRSKKHCFYGFDGSQAVLARHSGIDIFGRGRCFRK
jgi:hypothetical protein